MGVVDNIDHLRRLDNLDNIDHMEKPYDSELNKFSRNQLAVMRFMVAKPDAVVTTDEIARRTGIVEKQLGGVLSAMSRRRVEGTALIEPMGRDDKAGLRWKLNTKAITISLAIGRIKVLLASYR